MKFSDEMINAFADGELQGSEKIEFEAALQIDNELRDSLDSVLELKSQLRSAYAQVVVPASVPHNSMNYKAVLFSCLLLLAFSGGWICSDMFPGQAPYAGWGKQFVDQDMHQLTGADHPGRYILHIGDHDTQKFQSILDTAENLMVKYQNEMHLVELEVIANASGLDLFRDGESPFAQRVKLLSKKYPNIKFIACSNAVERLRERGIEPNLINAIHQGPTALDQVVKRMNDGWTYIKI